MSGIQVEQLDSLNEDDSRYNYDNAVFTEGKAFIYDFQIISKEGDTLLFRVPSKDNMYKAPWEFVALDITDKTDVVNQLKIKTLTGLGFMGRSNPGYSQTVVMYEYLTQDGKIDYNSISGVIENEKNLWAHPPRDYYFNILELNPFPYIKFPLKIGAKWNWELEIGSKWGDERWRTWEGNITNSYSYEVESIKEIDFKDQKLECYKVIATAESQLGKTKLNAYFHPEVGFIHLNYTNIDGSQVQLKLNSVQAPR